MKIIFKKPSCPPKANSSKKDLVYQNHPRLLEPWFFKKYLLFAYIFQVNFSLIHPHHCWVPTFNRWWSCEGPESMAKDPGVFSRFFFCHGFLTRAPRWSCWNRDQDSPYGWSALKGFEWSMICSKKNGDRNRNAMAMISRHFRNKKGRSLRCCNLFFPNTFWKKFEKFVSSRKVAAAKSSKCTLNKTNQIYQMQGERTMPHLTDVTQSWKLDSVSMHFLVPVTWLMPINSKGKGFKPWGSKISLSLQSRNFKKPFQKWQPPKKLKHSITWLTETILSYLTARWAPHLKNMSHNCWNLKY